MSGPQVVDFLARIKHAIKERRFAVVNRDKNLAFLEARELGLSDVETIVECLMVQDLKSGPEADRDGSSGEIWIFQYRHQLGSRVETLYVKLKLYSVSGVEYGKAISIHD